MKGLEPYNPTESIYNLIFLIVKIAGSFKKLSFVLRATACPMKSQVLVSNPYLDIISLNGYLTISISFQVLGFFSSKF